MPTEPRPPLHRRREARSRSFHSGRERRAANPLDAAARVFDRWRRAVAKLPAKYQRVEIDEVTAYLRDRARQIEPEEEGDRNDDR